jgi:DNA (cytosine-5)-methyltransferase 1
MINPLMSNPYQLHKPGRLRGGNKPTAVDLFSGAGGITLGLLNAGFNVRLCADLDEACEQTHRRNFPAIPFRRADISKLRGKEILSDSGLREGELNLLIGGPPCQGFSILGQRELWDPRNGLFHEFLRIAGELAPECVVIENVTGLATLGKGAVLREIGAAFAVAGYNADCAELLAAQYGVPQMRWRMFFIGWRMDLNRRGGFPAPTHGKTDIGDLVPNRTISQADSAGFVTIRDAIGDLSRIEAGDVGTGYRSMPCGAYQAAMRREAPPHLANHYAARLSKQNMARLRALKPGQDWRSLPHELLPAGMQRAHRKDHTRRYRRMQWDGVARSIITRFRDPKSGEYTHPEQHRTISIREAARIQSFPDWFVFQGSTSQQYDQVGNAVPPLLARAVARELRAMLNGRPRMQRPPVKSRYRIPAVAELSIAPAECG